MKYIKIVICLFIFTALFISMNLYSFASEDGFMTEELSNDDKELFLSNNDIHVITAEEKSRPISCFDVNSDGSILLGFYSTDPKKISVYDENGVFRYGYSFDCYGTFGVEWNGDNVTIYFVRSGIAATFDENAECLEVKKIENTIENNTYWNDVVFSSVKTVDDNKYQLKNDMGFLNLFASSYSKLVKIDADRQESTFYDVNNSYLLNLLCKFIMIIILFIGVILTFIWEYMRWKKGHVIMKIE